MARFLLNFPEFGGDQPVEGPVRRFEQRRDDFERLNDKEFQQRLRLDKQTFANLLHQLEPDITPKIPTNNAVAATTKLQCSLRFLASGSLYRLNSDLYGISPASMSRHLFQVVDAIVDRVNHFNRYI